MSATKGTRHRWRLTTTAKDERRCEKCGLEGVLVRSSGRAVRARRRGLVWNHWRPYVDRFGRERHELVTSPGPCKPKVGGA